MSSHALVPTFVDNAAEWGILSASQKESVRSWALAFKEFEDGIRASVLACALRVPVKTFYNRRSEFKIHGWRALCNKRKGGALHLKKGQKITLSQEAEDYLKSLYDKNQCASMPAARAFLRQIEDWQKGDISKRIPGFAECPKGSPPAGMSVRTLMRYQTSRFERKAARRGLSHAIGDCGPQVFTTRSTLWLMAEIYLDDVWHDNFVTFQRQGLCRPLELDALDRFSGDLIAWGTKPRIRNPDGTHNQKLAKFVPMIMAACLGNLGYHPRGTTFFFEHGTAAMPERLKKLFHEQFPEEFRKIVKFKESGIVGERQALFGWRGKGKGNSRMKAALESHHRLKHLELGSLPAQTGMNRDTRPEYTHGILEDDDDLLAAFAQMAKTHPERAAQLQTRTLDYHSAFLPLLMEAYRIINERTWHKLEGWEKIPGNIVQRYKLAPESPDMSENDFQRLGEEVQAMVIAASAKDRRYIQPHRLSPAAVVRRDQHQLIKLPDWALCEIMVGNDPDLWHEFSRELGINGAYFKRFSDDELSPEPFLYQSQILTPRGEWKELPEDRYLCLQSPFDASKLYVHDYHQKFLGTSPLETRAETPEQLNAKLGRQQARVKTMLQPLVNRHAADIRAETKRLKNNADAMTTPTVQLDKMIERIDPVAEQLKRAAKRVPSEREDEEWTD